MPGDDFGATKGLFFFLFSLKETEQLELRLFKQKPFLPLQQSMRFTVFGAAAAAGVHQGQVRCPLGALSLFRKVENCRSQPTSGMDRQIFK